MHIDIDEIDANQTIWSTMCRYTYTHAQYVSYISELPNGFIFNVNFPPSPLIEMELIFRKFN